MNDDLFSSDPDPDSEPELEFAHLDPQPKKKKRKLNRTPRSFVDVADLWLNVFSMNERFFAFESLRASHGNTFLGIFVSGIITIGLTILYAMLSAQAVIQDPAFQQLNSLPELQNLNIFSGGSLLLTGIIMVFVYPLGYYIGNGVYLVVAKMLGGIGDFKTQAYLISLFTAPLTILSSIFSLLALVPNIGGLLSGLLNFGVFIFSVILYTRVFKVIHRLTTGRAVLAFFLPSLFACACSGCFFFMLTMGGISQAAGGF